MKKSFEQTTNKHRTSFFINDILGNNKTAEKKKKKLRTTFTGKQIYELEKVFENKKYLSSIERAQIAILLRISETQVKIWFQNRRTKWKKTENISNAKAIEYKLKLSNYKSQEHYSDE